MLTISQKNNRNEKKKEKRQSYNDYVYFLCLNLCIVEFNFTSPVRNVTLPSNSKRSQHQHRCLGHDTHDCCRSGVSDFHMFCFVLSPRGCIQKEPLFLLQVSQKLWLLHFFFFRWHDNNIIKTSLNRSP